MAEHCAAVRTLAAHPLRVTSSGANPTRPVRTFSSVRITIQNTAHIPQALVRVSRWQQFRVPPGHVLVEPVLGPKRLAAH